MSVQRPAAQLPLRRVGKFEVNKKQRWKERLRQACIDRAKTKRRDVIMRKRRLHSSANDFDSSLESARMIVEEELFNQRMNTDPQYQDEIPQTSCSTLTLQLTPTISKQIDHGSSSCVDLDFTTTASCATNEKRPDFIDGIITEDDLHEILQDVEDELRRDGKSLVLRNSVHAKKF